MGGRAGGRQRQKGKDAGGPTGACLLDLLGSTRKQETRAADGMMLCAVLQEGLPRVMVRCGWAACRLVRCTQPAEVSCCGVAGRADAMMP